MTKHVAILRHNTSEADEYVGPVGELTYDITAKNLRLHDGITPGGTKTLTKSQADMLYTPILPGILDFSPGLIAFNSDNLPFDITIGSASGTAVTVNGLTGAAAFNFGLATDTIAEKTAGAGVTIDGLLIKDGVVPSGGFPTIPVNKGGTGATTAAGALTNLGFSSFMDDIVDDANLAAFLTTLGLSTDVKAVLSAADASAILTVLGFSTLFKSLRDDTTLAAFNTTLGLSANVQGFLECANISAMMSALGFSTFFKTLVAVADNAAMGALLQDTQLVGVNAQSASYTLVLGDAGKAVEISNASANTLTVPPNSSVAFPVGTEITFAQMGAGQITITAGVGVTLRAYGGGLKLRGQYATGAMYKRATNEWVVGGNLTT